MTYFIESFMKYKERLIEKLVKLVLILYINFIHPSFLNNYPILFRYGLKKYKEKWVKKVSGIRISLLYISFIVIKYE